LLARCTARPEPAECSKPAIQRRAPGVEILANISRAQRTQVSLTLPAYLRLSDKRVRADRCDDDCEIDQQPPR
jgi:hypothetical protein